MMLKILKHIKELKIKKSSVIARFFRRKNRGNPVLPDKAKHNAKGVVTTLQKAVQVAFNLYEYCRYNAYGVG